MLRSFAGLAVLIGLLLSVPVQAEFTVPSCDALDEWAAEIPTVRGADRDHGFAVAEQMKSSAVSEAVFGKPYETLSAEELSELNRRLIECIREVDRGVDPRKASRLAQTQTFVHIDELNRGRPRPEEPIQNNRQTR